MGIFDDINDAYKNVTGQNGSDNDLLDNAIDLTLNYMTFGLAGYESGGLKKGVASRGTDEVVGEISGRNMARKEIMNRQDALAEEKTARAALMQQEQERNRLQDVQSSQTAAALQRSSAEQQRGFLGSASGKLTSDFLGL